MRTTEKSIKALQSIYVAGLIDAKGRVQLKKINCLYVPYVEYIQGAEGINVIAFLRDQFKGTVSRGGSRICWEGDRAYDLLKEISPVMMVRGLQSELVIKFYDRLQVEQLRTKHCWFGEFRSYADEVYFQIKRLNKDKPNVSSPACKFAQVAPSVEADEKPVGVDWY